MRFLDKLFGRSDSESDVIRAAETMLTAKVDVANRQRSEMATRLTQLQNRLKEVDSTLRRGDVQGIQRRQAEEDFTRTARSIELSSKEAALLNQSLLEAEEARAKARELIAGRTQANEADILVQLKMVMETLDQKRQLTQMAMSDLRTTEMSTAPVAEPTAALQSATTGLPTPMAAAAGTDAAPSPASSADTSALEAAKAAERRRKMDELMGSAPA